MNLSYLRLAFLCLYLFFVSGLSEVIAQPVQVRQPTEIAVANPCREFNQWINSLFFSSSTISWFYQAFGEELGHYLVTYFRDLIAGIILYYGTAGIWHWYIYVYRGSRYFPEGDIPSKSMIKDQIMLAQCSIFMYAALPVLAEWFVEMKWTKCYFNISEIGGFYWYLLYTLMYLSFVEFGIYWVHRTLHTNKFLYKYVHALHHKYNSPNDLSPWASIAFNPIDGILQASPYVVGLFFVPCHYFTHMLMLFFTGIWATNIHDALNCDFEPVMGSKYHTIHHTHYHYNFGQFFTFCDRIFGTLRGTDQITIRRRKIKRT